MMLNKSFVFALATLTGTIIGVGLFSLPYITSKVGLLVISLYFLILGALVILVSLIYGEIVLRTKGLHRLPGYALKYLGPKGRNITLFSNSLGLYGAILAYLIVGGKFLTSIFEQVYDAPEIIYTLIFFSAGAILIFFGIKSIAQTELIGLGLFFLVLILIFIKGFPAIDLSNLTNFQLEHLFFPYGPVLFSLGGMALIPEVKEILKAQPQKLKKVICLAVVIAAITYLCFIILVTGISGTQTTDEAIIGLRGFFSDNLIKLFFIFGILTTFTSFIALGLTLKKTFWYDLGINKNISWALVCFVPLALFALGLKDFINVISLTGGILLAVDVVVIILIYLKAKKKGQQKPAYRLVLPNRLVYFLMFLFLLGAVCEVIFFLKI